MSLAQGGSGFNVLSPAYLSGTKLECVSLESDEVSNPEFVIKQVRLCESLCF